MHTRIQERPPTPVKSHRYTPKIQTFFTLMLSRATKAIKWSFAGGPMTARFCGIWILSPPHQLKRHEIYRKKRCQSQNFLDPRLLRERESIWCP